MLHNNNNNNYQVLILKEVYRNGKETEGERSRVVLEVERERERERGWWLSGYTLVIIHFKSKDF